MSVHRFVSSVEATRVWKDHQVIASYPPHSIWEVSEEVPGMVIEEPDGTRHLYGPDDYDAIGAGLVCGYRADDPNCPNCHPPASS